MPPHFSKVLSSKLVEIKSSDKTFFIHGAIAEKSEPLRHAVAGEGGKIDLSDWDSGTVELFVEFLYTGDYVLEQTTQGEGESKGVTEGESEIDVPDQGPGDPYRNLLLAHAKVYTLAHNKKVEELESLAFERLKVALGAIDGRTVWQAPRGVEDVIGLVTYVYSYTGNIMEPDAAGFTDRGDTDTGVTIRDILSTFVAKNFERMVHNRKKMSLLLTGGGDFAIELLEKVARRVLDIEISTMRDMRDLDEGERELGDTTTPEEIIQQRFEAVNGTIEKLVDKVQAFQTSYYDKIKELEERIRELEVSSGSVRQLEDRIWELDQIPFLEEGVQEVGVIKDKVEKLEERVISMEERLRWM